jgi:uncharacterized protein
MKIKLFSAIICAPFLCLSSAHAQLIISGVVDGPLTGGTPKAVELFATSNISDLSQWGLGSANNGGGSDGVEIILTESPFFTSFFGFAPNFVHGGATNINGDDAIELFFDPSRSFSGAQTVIDTFGDINISGTGQSWDYMDGWAYRRSGTGATGSTFNSSHWVFSGINALDGVLTNAGASIPIPVGTYSVPEAKHYSLGAGLAAIAFTIYRRRKAKKSWF